MLVAFFLIRSNNNRKFPRSQKLYNSSYIHWPNVANKNKLSQSTSMYHIKNVNDKESIFKATREELWKLYIDTPICIIANLSHENFTGQEAVA